MVSVYIQFRFGFLKQSPYIGVITVAVGGPFGGSIDYYDMIFMKNVTKFLLVALVAAVTISFASNSSASSRFSRSEYRSITVTFAPSADGTFGGLLTPRVPTTSDILYVPVYRSNVNSLRAFFYSGSDEDTTDGDDSTDGDDDGDDDHGDTTDVGDDDSTGDDHGDTTDVGDDDSTGDDHGDTTDVGDDDTTGDDHGDDSTDIGDDHHGGDHHDNDTIDCDDHHDGHHDDDTTATTDTTVRAMFGSGSQSIVIKTSRNSALIGLQFVNNEAANVVISKIAFAAGMNFTIVSGAPNHATTLAPGQRINLTVRYTPNGASGQTDQLLITSNSTAPVNPITFKGIQNATSSVTNVLPEGVSFTTAPNPMTTSLTVNVSGVRTSDVSIYTTNGIMLTSSVVTNSWTWDGAVNGFPMPNGAYIVRITGTSADGTPFASTRKIVLNK